MASEIRCTGCEGPLGWAGSQLSCHSCGKVHTLAGKPGSKLGVLIIGVFIGVILGFIGAYELNRFVLDSDEISEVSTEESAKVTDTLTRSPPSFSHTIEPHEFAYLMTGEQPEQAESFAMAEAARPDVSFELHSYRPSGDYVWIYGRTTNRSPQTVEMVKAVAILKDEKGKAVFQDDFYATRECLAPGQSEWTTGLVDQVETTDLSLELYPVPASSCNYPALGMEVEFDHRLAGTGRAVFGHVTNGGKWPVKFARIHVYQFDDASGLLVNSANTYLEGILQPGQAQRFSVDLYQYQSSRFEVVVTGRPQGR